MSNAVTSSQEGGPLFAGLKKNRIGFRIHACNDAVDLIPQCAYTADPGLAWTGRIQGAYIFFLLFFVETPFCIYGRSLAIKSNNSVFARLYLIYIIVSAIVAFGMNYGYF